MILSDELKVEQVERDRFYGPEWQKAKTDEERQEIYDRALGEYLALLNGGKRVAQELKKDEMPAVVPVEVVERRSEPHQIFGELQSDKPSPDDALALLRHWNPEGDYKYEDGRIWEFHGKGEGGHYVTLCFTDEMVWWRGGMIACRGVPICQWK